MAVFVRSVGPSRGRGEISDEGLRVGECQSPVRYYHIIHPFPFTRPFLPSVPRCYILSLPVSVFPFSIFVFVEMSATVRCQHHV